MDGEKVPHPYKFDAERRALYLEKLSAGMRRGDAAKAVGVTRATVRDHYNADPEFAAACDQAEIDACDLVEHSLHMLALQGNFPALKFWLVNRSKDRWKEQNAIGKLSAIEDLLAKLPAESAAILRQVLAGQESDGGGPGQYPDAASQPAGEVPG